MANWFPDRGRVWVTGGSWTLVEYHHISGASIDFEVLLPHDLWLKVKTDSIAQIFGILLLTRRVLKHSCY